MDRKTEFPIEQFEIFATGLDHPEGLAFDRQGNLWAGGEAGQIYRIDPHGKVAAVANLDGFCAGLAFSPQDDLFVCNARLGIVKVTRDGSYSVFSDHIGRHKIKCANYPVFDRRGNLFVTDSGLWKKKNGYLLRFTPDGKGDILGGPYGYANGLALSQDEKDLYMVESDTNRIFHFDVREDGAIGAASTFAEQVGRLPDGLTLDTEGNLYASCYASDEIYRIDPTGTKKLLAFDPYGILLGGPTNLAFGGKDFDELFVANLSRYAITRIRIYRRGQPLANGRSL